MTLAFDLSLQALRHSFAITKDKGGSEEGLFIIGGVGSYKFLGSLWFNSRNVQMIIYLKSATSLDSGPDYDFFGHKSHKA